jgi:L-iditol 2-dehydrogenase
MTAPGQIELREVAKPEAAPGQLLIRVRRIGICGSDIHVYHGVHPYTRYPVVQGHEVSGEVSAMGSGVEEFAPGDRVTFMPQVTCGTCYPCRHGSAHICDNLKVMGFQTDGAAQEYFPVFADRVLKLPADMSLEQGAMIEPAAVAVHALCRAGDVCGKAVVVLGAGPIGNLVGQTAKGLGARSVLIVDLSDYRLQVARECGLDFAVNPEKERLGQAIRRHLGTDLADLIMECVGSETTIGEAIACARKGSTIVVVGVFGRKPVFDIGLVQDRELNLLGTLMYQRVDYEKAIELGQAGKLDFDQLITDSFPLERYLEAYRHIERSRDRSIKVMIRLEG